MLSKRENRWLLFAVLRIALAIWVWPLVAPGAQSGTEPSRPRYDLQLTLNEFSILNAAEVDGLLKYGGTGDFQVRMAPDESSNVVWTVTTENPRQIEIWGIYVGEKAVRLMREFSFQNLDTNSRAAMQAIAGLGHKIEFAQKNPIWSETQVAGAVVQQGTNWLIQTADALLRVTGTNRTAVSNWVGRRVVAKGTLKTSGQFEPVRLIEQRTNTLELFVMSFCPFGQTAETKLFGFLDSTNSVQNPKLEVRYLFYKQQKNGKEVFASLHGEEEIMENLVQIVLRDHYANWFRPYVRLRAESGKLPWRTLLDQLGVEKWVKDEIASIITSRRDTLLEAEYDYATGQYGIKDGSPSFVWESQRVTDLTKIDEFKALKNFSTDTCAE